MTVEVRIAPEMGSACARISGHARILSGQLRSLSTSLFPPAATKTLRSFSSGEVAKVVGFRMVTFGSCLLMASALLQELPTLDAVLTR